ncbi:MAG: hypothetical protein ACP5HZ_11550 [Ferrimicrobium sp.]|uniref:hypothetical protein n=1 Tax=Ferrimicrobium sp. TaxID=2926050 RepID=UPI00262F5099|nr:hypothetical protein [Ferrimicrobium sp.]
MESSVAGPLSLGRRPSVPTVGAWSERLLDAVVLVIGVMTIGVATAALVATL